MLCKIKLLAITLILIGHSQYCIAQEDSTVKSNLLSRVYSFCVGAELGTAHLDVFLLNNLPENFAPYMSFHAGFNKFIVWSGIRPSTSADLSYEFFLVEIGLGYKIELPKNFFLVPKIGSAGGVGNFENVEFATSKGFVLGMELEKAILIKGNNRLLIGCSIDYRNLKYEPNNIFTSADMIGLTIKFGYEYRKLINKN